MSGKTRRAPLYESVKRHLIEGIESGLWRVGDRLPSEHQLTRRFGVSRMTVNRAMKELEAAGFIERVAGSGSFVADRRVQGELVEIHDLAGELAHRGHRHRCELLERRDFAADGEWAEAFALDPGAPLHYARVLHYRDDQPVLLEERRVNLAVAPEYAAADLNRETSYQVLMRLAPLQRAEHVVRAVPATSELRELLALAENEPCLLVHRRTWAKGSVASLADLWHAGSRYELIGRVR